MMTSANILNPHILLACALMLSGSAFAQQQSVVTPSQGGAAPAAAAAKSAEASPAVQEPRIIRGDDRVYAPPKGVPSLTGSSSSYKFEDAPIVEVIHVFMREVLKVDYVLHQPLMGSVTLATKGPVSPDDALALLESALQVNGLAMARDTRGVYHVGKPENLKSVAGNIRQSVGKDPLPPGYGAVIVPLEYIGANEMATILRPMAPADAIVRVDSVRNLLVLMGTRNQAEGWLDVVRTFDINLLKGMSVGLFPLKHASIKEVEAALGLMSGGGAAAAARPSGTAPAGAAAGGAPASATGNRAAAASVGLGEGNPLFGALRIMPVERLNSILVVTPRAAYLEEARRWIDKLDQPSDGGAEPQLYIYRVQNGNARHLASVLNGIFGGTSAANVQGGSGVAPGLNSVIGATQGQYSGTGAFGNTAGNLGNSFGGGLGGGLSSGFGRGGLGSNTFPQQNRLNQVGTQPPVAAQLGSVRVMADDLNNILLVWSTKSEFDKMEATLKRLDLPPTQVLIEASIIEVTLNDDLSYGLQWAFNGGTGGGNRGYGQLGTGGITPGTGSLADAGTKGFTYSLVNSAGQIRVALSALADKTKVKMISNPSLMVLDNHLAMMVVGNQVPVKSSTTDWPNNSTGVTTSTIQYRDTGVNLSVTPSVNAGNLVTMQIDQTVTDSTNPQSDTPTFLQRQISSKVAVRSGESIVLGGLIKDSQNQGKTGIPLLQDLPLVGNLFGATTLGGNRTELLVVITPKVVRTDPEIREVSEELRDRLRGLGELGSPRGNAPVTVVPVAPVVQPPAAP
jgi:general secretion pathway protein D